jgi:hypothetical protein
MSTSGLAGLDYHLAWPSVIAIVISSQGLVHKSALCIEASLSHPGYWLFILPLLDFPLRHVNPSKKRHISLAQRTTNALYVMVGLTTSR